MTRASQQDRLKLGFLTAIELGGFGFVGGLLVTNHFGRPLEFQCTTPVKPNRTQEILYGPTLVPFVLGELIGKTLVEKVDVKPDLLLIDDGALFDLRLHIATPVICVDRKAADAAEGETGVSQPQDAPDPANGREDGEQTRTDFRLGKNRIRFHRAHLEDRDSVEKSQGQIPQDADLTEPFQRVREALQETIGSGAAR